MTPQHIDGPSRSLTETKFSITDLFLGMSPSQRLITILLGITVVVSGTQLIQGFVNTSLVENPRTGGTYREAIIGTPRFVNPLLAISSADRDLVALVYAGLMTRDADGSLVPHLAESYSLSEDKKTYTFKIRTNARFHDGTPVTANDVVFTVTQAQNQNLRSPKLASWEGVLVEALDQYTVTFTLPEPYAPFIENTTLGILPKHLWEPLKDDQFAFSSLNTNPVGAGPYSVDRIVVGKSGIPERYELTAFSAYVLGKPAIEEVHLLLYSNRESAFTAYTSGLVHALHGVSAEDTASIDTNSEENDMRIVDAPQLRIFAIFLNQNRQPLFLNSEVRTALNVSTPKESIASEIFLGYATILNSPLLALHNTDTANTPEETQTMSASNTNEARAMLEQKDWELDETTQSYTREKDDQTERLAFTLSTVNSPELIAVAELVAQEWRTAGAEVELKTYEATDLTQTVIRPRRYEALLFGIDIGHEADLYAFWHSSQRNDPGLNISQYADIDSDALLEKMRTETDSEAHLKLVEEFVERLNSSNTDIFLFAPHLIYLTRDSVQNIRMRPVADPSERFYAIHEWYMETDKVWPFVRNFLQR